VETLSDQGYEVPFGGGCGGVFFFVVSFFLLGRVGWVWGLGVRLGGVGAGAGWFFFLSFFFFFFVVGGVFCGGFGGGFFLGGGILCVRRHSLGV